MVQSPKNNGNGVFISRDRINSISLFAVLVCILAFSSIYVAGIQRGSDIANANMQENLVGAAYSEPVAECLVYSDEVVISDIECEFHTQCAPNGICIKDLEKCAFFVN